MYVLKKKNVPGFWVFFFVFLHILYAPLAHLWKKSSGIMKNTELQLLEVLILFFPCKIVFQMTLSHFQTNYKFIESETLEQAFLTQASKLLNN